MNVQNQNLEGKSCSALLRLGLLKFVNHLLSFHLTTKKVKVVIKPQLYDLRMKTSETAQNPQVFLLGLLSGLS